MAIHGTVRAKIVEMDTICDVQPENQDVSFLKK